MKKKRRATMLTRAVGYDLETHLVQTGLLTPPLVCGSVGWYDGARVQGALLGKDAAMVAASDILADENAVMCGANIAFDLLVVANEAAKRGVDAFPAIFKALEEERIYDLQHAEALNAIADGHLFNDPRTGKPLKNPLTGKPSRYSLAMCVDLTLGRTDAKANDEWRERYAELESVPQDQWPAPARDYPVDDAKNTVECSLAQVGELPKTTIEHRWIKLPDGTHRCGDCGTAQYEQMCVVKRPHRNLHDLAAQVWTAFAMHAGAAWGFRVDQSQVDIIEKHALRNRAAGITPFKESGVIREDDTEDRSALKRRVAIAYGSSELCPICAGTGKVPSPSNPKSRIICFRLGEDGRTKLKTCDGTGFVISDDVPRSEKEGIGYGRDVLHESGDEFLMSYGDFLEDKKDLVDYVPYLREARRTATDADGTIRHVDIPLTLKPNPILETGRVSYSGYIQLFKRAPGHEDEETGEYVPSLRECIVARGPRYERVEVPDDYVLQPGERVVK